MEVMEVTERMTMEVTEPVAPPGRLPMWLRQCLRQAAGPGSMIRDDGGRTGTRDGNGRPPGLGGRRDGNN